MLEEWKGDAGVQVLEGWSFQVCSTPEALQCSFTIGTSSFPPSKYV